MPAQRQNAGGLVGGLILIGLGAFFLFAQYVGFEAFRYVWPLLMIGLGGAFFFGMLAGGHERSGLAIPGSIFVALGLLLLLQNLTGGWETWAYAWTVIIMAAGVGVFISGAWTGDNERRRAGLRLAGIGLMLLLVFGAFFELLIFGRFAQPWRQVVMPALLILLGLYLLITRGGLLLRRTLEPPAAPAPGELPEPRPASPPEA